MLFVINQWDKPLVVYFTIKKEPKKSFSKIPISPTLGFSKLPLTALFKNTWILKFKSQLMFAFFTAANHLSGSLRKQKFVIGGFRSALCLCVASLLVIVIILTAAKRQLLNFSVRVFLKSAVIRPQNWLLIATKTRKFNTPLCSLTIYKITQIVRALWLAERRVCMRVNMVVTSRCFTFRALITQARIWKRFWVEKFVDKFTLFTHFLVDWNLENLYKHAVSIFFSLELTF